MTLGLPIFGFVQQVVEDSGDIGDDQSAADTEVGLSSHDTAQPHRTVWTAARQKSDHSSSSRCCVGDSIATAHRTTSGSQGFPKGQIPGAATTPCGRPHSAVAVAVADTDGPNRTRMRGMRDSNKNGGAAITGLRPKSAGVDGCSDSFSFSRCPQQRCKSASSRSTTVGAGTATVPPTATARSGLPRERRASSPPRQHRAARRGKGKVIPRKTRKKGSADHSDRSDRSGRRGVEAAWSYATTTRSDCHGCGVIRRIFVKVPCVRSNISKVSQSGRASYQIAWYDGSGHTDENFQDGSANCEGLSVGQHSADAGVQSVRIPHVAATAAYGRVFRSLLANPIGIALKDTAFNGESSCFDSDEGHNNSSIDEDCPRTDRVLAQLRGSVGRVQQAVRPSSPGTHAAQRKTATPASAPFLGADESITIATSCDDHGRSAGSTTRGGNQGSCSTHRAHQQSNIVGETKGYEFSKFRRPNAHMPIHRASRPKTQITRSESKASVERRSEKAFTVRLGSWGAEKQRLLMTEEEDRVISSRTAETTIERTVDTRHGHDSNIVGKERGEKETSMDYSFFPSGLSEQPRDGGHDGLSSTIKSACEGATRGVTAWEESTMFSIATDARKGVGLDFGSPVPSEAVGW